MREDPRIRAFARKLAALSFDESGRPSAERMRAVLEVLRDMPLRNRRALLVAIRAAVARREAQSTALVEHAGALPADALETLRAGLERRLGRPLTCQTREAPGLIAGVRVTVGDDVWDDSLSGRLEALRAALR